MLESKLPEKIRVAVLANKKGKWDMDKLLEALATQINIREISKPVNPQKRDSEPTK